MKKIVFILIAATMLFTACNSGGSNSEHHDFRNVDFGMSTIELLEIEGEPDTKYEYDDLSTYYYDNKEAFGVENAVLQYQIDKNGVGYGQATFQNKYADNKSYITEYNTVKKNLISAWGEPESITEDEEKFDYRCTWGHKSLTLSKDSEDKAFINVVACSTEYLELSLERIKAGQSERQQTATE